MSGFVFRGLCKYAESPLLTLLVHISALLEGCGRDISLEEKDGDRLAEGFPSPWRQCRLAYSVTPHP